MARYVKSGTVNTVQEINSELEKIATAQDEFLTRNGESPNEMKDTLDMNGKRITNLSAPVTLNEPLRLADRELVTAALADATVVTNVATMLVTDFSIGDYVVTEGYYSVGDKGNAEYVIVAGATGAADGGSFHNLSNGNQAKLILSGTPNVKQFGGVGDGTTNITSVVNKAALFLGSGQLDFPYEADGYVINTPVTISNLTCVFNGENQLVGTATLQDVNGISVLNGAYQGYIFSPEVRGKQIEIISGTLRAQQYQTAVSFTSSGTVGTIVQTAHGYSVDDYIYTRGSDDFKWVGTFQITAVVDADTYQVTVESTGPTVAGGTALILKPGLWEWIKDAGHEPLGVDDSVPVQTDATGLGLRISMLKNYSKVLTMVVSPDEQLAGAQNMSIGASVSLNGLDLRASVDRTIASRIFYDGTNWVKNEGTDQSGIFDEIISYSAGNLTVPHGFCKGRAISVMPDSASGTVGSPFIPLMKLPSDDNFILNFMDPVDGSFYTGPLSTRMSFTVTKNYCGLIFFDGRDGSGSIGMQFGNIWFFGIMEV